MAEVQAGQQVAQETPTNPAEVATPAPDQPAPKEPAAPSRTYSQDEVDRLLNKVRKNARYLGRKEAEAELLRQGATPRQAEEAVSKPAVPADDAPKREQFESYEDYLIAKSRHEARQASREEHEKLSKRERDNTASEQRRKTEQEFRRRVESVRGEIPDFDDVIEAAGTVPLSDAMSDAIQESPIGPRIVYHLAKNPQEAERIAQLAPNAQIREIGKLEARIEAGKPTDPKATEKPEPSKEPSKAPEPIEPVGARGAPASDQPSEKDDMKTWMRKRQKQVHGR